MSVVIQNMGKIKGETDDWGGLHQYQLRINHSVIAEFIHARRDGLATCLRLAAKAVEEQEAREFEESIAEILKDDNITEEEAVTLALLKERLNR